jgi:hypothetical protein
VKPKVLLSKIKIISWICKSINDYGYTNPINFVVPIKYIAIAKYTPISGRAGGKKSSC